MVKYVKGEEFVTHYHSQSQLQLDGSVHKNILCHRMCVNTQLCVSTTIIAAFCREKTTQ